MTIIPFVHAGHTWHLIRYDTANRQSGQVTKRAAAYLLEDEPPRGPRRTWVVVNGELELWAATGVSMADWPELDEAAARALERLER